MCIFLPRIRLIMLVDGSFLFETFLFHRCVDLNDTYYVGVYIVAIYQGFLNKSIIKFKRKYPKKKSVDFSIGNDDRNLYDTSK